MNFIKNLKRVWTGPTSVIAAAAAMAAVAIVLCYLATSLSLRYLETYQIVLAAFGIYGAFVASTSRKIGRMDPATGRYNLYLRRFYLTPRIPFFNVRFFLHHILRSDDDTWPHDHPWPFTSMILAGKYIEHVFYPDPYRHTREYKGHDNHATPGTILINPATHTHKIEIVRPVWSLVLAGGGEREWGFWVMDGNGPDRWVQWEEYLGIKKGSEVHGEDRIVERRAARDNQCPGF